MEADTPADAKLIELKETEHSHDILVPGPTQYVSSPVLSYHAGGFVFINIKGHAVPFHSNSLQ